MKVVRRVSLFLVLSVFLLGTGGYTALKVEQFFYPNKYQEKGTLIKAYVPYEIYARLQKLPDTDDE